MNALESQHRPKTTRRAVLLAMSSAMAGIASGCSLGPRSLLNSRLSYNDAVKTTSEQQLLLNIVRLRYTDTPSSLAISSIADQQELIAGLGLVPFFTAAGAGNVGSYRNSLLPSAQVSGTSRPTLSYTPLDDEEFTRRLFSPISLEGVAYLSKTTWPISTVFRLYLENINWVSNAETASGPTPEQPPEFASFLAGVLALQRLQDRSRITLYTEEREDAIVRVSSNENIGTLAIEAVKSGLDVKSNSDEILLVRKRKQPVLRADESLYDDEDWHVFCHAFGLNPTLRTFDLTSDKLDPYFKDTPASGLEILDLESRSLLQVLFFVAHGVDVPPEHIACRIVPSTVGNGGSGFDWQQVLGGLFRVQYVKSKHRPDCAHIAIQYNGYWFYIDARDRETKATFALLLEVSRLELESTKTRAPILTLPLGG
jgi:hypothetical protein